MSMNVAPVCENEHSRIETFVDFMGEYVTGEVVYELQKMGFFVAPASIHYHGKYEGALFDHSYEVAKSLVHLTKKLGLRWELNRSPYVVGMFHDLCKANDYTKVSFNDSWNYNDNILLPGHGEKSVIMTQKFMQLTDEEIFCIRWHMGAFDDKENWKYYSRAVGDYPNVLYTHTADMIASQIKGV